MTKTFAVVMTLTFSLLTAACGGDANAAVCDKLKNATEASPDSDANMFENAAKWFDQRAAEADGELADTLRTLAQDFRDSGKAMGELDIAAMTAIGTRTDSHRKELNKHCGTSF